MYGFNAPEDKGSVALGSMGSVSALSQVEDAASEAARVWLPSGHSRGKSTKKWVKTYKTCEHPMKLLRLLGNFGKNT